MKLYNSIYPLAIPIIVWDKAKKTFFRQMATYYVGNGETPESTNENLPIEATMEDRVFEPVQWPIDEWGGVHKGKFWKNFIRIGRTGDTIDCFHPGFLAAFNEESGKFKGAFNSVKAKLDRYGIRVEMKQYGTLPLIVEGKKDDVRRLRFFGDPEKGLPFEILYDTGQFTEEKLAEDMKLYFQRFFSVFPAPDEITTEVWMTHGRGKEYEFMKGVCKALEQAKLPFHFVVRKAGAIGD